MEELLSFTRLSVYALPFNLLVPVFLYVLQQRQSRTTGLQLVVVQHNSPERNLYAWSNYHNRLSRKAGILFRLPVLGKWKISQGHEGRLTHRADWRFAWDFVKEAADGLTYTGDGARLTDYLCYAKPVYPAADGAVDSVVDGIPDNSPGDANTAQNWGNTVVIRHAYGLYSKYSHLKPGTIRVKPGDYVLAGTELAQTGNSGRSPEPHLHFQFQSEPNIDAATIHYPFGYYLLHQDGKPSLKSYAIPLENDRVSNLTTDSLLKKSLHFIPGQKIRARTTRTDGMEVQESEWEVHTDYYNNSYIYDRRGNATAWFVNDGQLFYFTHYEGKRDNELFTFFSACFRIPLLFDKQLVISDQLPLSVISRSWLRWLQDWIAPFYVFLQFGFTLNYLEADDMLDPSAYRMKSGTHLRMFRKSIEAREFDIRILRGGSILVTSFRGTLELTTSNR
jgi:murein DD-endopeptidase MepM/ murein hydrolase activator NlpD